MAENIVDLSMSNFQQVASQDGVVVIDCWGPSCGPCLRFAPVFEKVAAKHPEVTWAKLNVEDNREVGAALEISAIPTVMVFRDSIMVFRNSGVLGGGQLEEIVAKASSLDMDEVRAEVARHQSPPKPTERFS